MKSKRSRAKQSGATAFVPRIVLKTVMASLTPALAAGCGQVIALADTAFRNDATDRGVIVLADSAFRLDASDATDNAEIQMGVADVGFDATIDAGTDATEDTPEPTDFGVIVLAQIGFEVDPNAPRDTDLASNTRTRTRDRAAEKVTRRGRA